MNQTDRQIAAEQDQIRRVRAAADAVREAADKGGMECAMADMVRIVRETERERVHADIAAASERVQTVKVVA